VPISLYSYYSYGKIEMQGWRKVLGIGQAKTIHEAAGADLDLCNGGSR